MMNKKRIFGILAVGMLVAEIAMLPKQAEAVAVAHTVIYDNENYKIEDYWNADSSKSKAPVKEGYVFGGWYKEKSESQYMTADEAATAVTKGTTAYAKFVPAQVLSVKAQNLAGTTETTETTYVRVISSLDSKNYQKVGFDIWLANQVQLFKDDETQTPLETDKIYDGLLVGKEKRHATEIFGGVSKYVSVWQLTGIDNCHFGKIIYVRPYWITMDGTKVEGLAKYVHIEDEYKGYISVPVNLLEKQEVAAGAISMTYDTDATFVEFEEGRMLPNMNYYHNEATNTIRMVGNLTAVDEYEAGESIYANIRFKKPSAATNFVMLQPQFCDWEEEPVTIEKVWDIKYVK